MNKKGFTLVELLICISIGIILATIVATSSVKTTSQGTKISFGVNGVTEERCISGYTFVVGNNGKPEQVVGANGGGIKCDDATVEYTTNPNGLVEIK